MEISSLNYETFIRMDWRELCAYMTHSFPKRGTLSDDVLQAFASNFSSMDEPHLAFAIEIVGRHSPKRLVPEMSQLLADSRVGVWTAASRMLLNFVPKDAVTPEMLQKFIEILRPHIPTVGKSTMIQQLIERFQS